MIKEKTKGMLIVVSGPSGAGKGTICKELISRVGNLKVSISMTSREPRRGEKDGVDYYFVTKDEFEERIRQDEFLEYAIVHNNQYYGTPKTAVEEELSSGTNVILEIDIQGALKIKEKIKEAIFIFIMPPSMEILKDRLVKRNTESDDKIMERFQTAYKEINEYKKYNYVVVNDDLNEAIEKVKSIIISEKCRVDRIEDIDLHNKEELMHENLINQSSNNENIFI